MNVKKAIEALEGVQKVDVNLEKKQAVVDFDKTKIGLDRIKAAIKEAGYQPM